MEDLLDPRDDIASVACGPRPESPHSLIHQYLRELPRGAAAMELVLTLPPRPFEKQSEHREATLHCWLVVARVLNRDGRQENCFFYLRDHVVLGHFNPEQQLRNLDHAASGMRPLRAAGELLRDAGTRLGLLAMREHGAVQA